MIFTRNSVVTAMLFACLACAVSAAPVPITPGSWTLAILPDTQHYAQTYPAIFAAQTQFLADNKNNLNIQMVLQEGDITNNSQPAEIPTAMDSCRCALTRAGSTAEMNINTSVAWFEFAAGWQGAHVTSGGAIAAAHGVTPAMLVKTGVGRYTLDLDVDSRSDGLLFAIGNNNSNRIVDTAVLADGSGWDLRIQTNTADFSATGTDTAADFSFVYLPLDTQNLIGGRYDGVANADLAAAGTFTMDHFSTGQYRLTIPGETPDTGMLILTTSYLTSKNGVFGPDDNILSYESDGLGNFIINSLDLNGGVSPTLQDTQFVWAFISFDDPITMQLPPIPGDVNFDGLVNIFDINFVSTNWGGTGPEGDANGDGTVNIFDINLISANWSPAAAVPEPSSFALLLAAGMLGLCWRLRTARS